VAKTHPKKDTGVNLKRKPLKYRYLLSLLLLSLHFLYSNWLVRTNLPSSAYLLDICVFQSSITEAAVQHTTATTLYFLLSPFEIRYKPKPIIVLYLRTHVFITQRRWTAKGSLGNNKPPFFFTTHR
jgi:hypothetical protein